MSVDRAQIEHLRSFVAMPRCMSYETIRSLGDILDDLEAASAEVADLRRQLEERKSPDVVTVPREDLAEWLTALRCSEPYVACGHDNAQKRLDAIESMTRALLSGEAGKGGCVISDLCREQREQLQATCDAIIADRDRLASELQAVRGELATARDALRGIWPFIEEDDGGFATPAYQEAINDVRAALAMTEDANP